MRTLLALSHAPTAWSGDLVGQIVEERSAIQRCIVTQINTLVNNNALS